MLSGLIFTSFPPRASPPFFNMNERLPRLALKGTDSFQSREEKFRLTFGMLHVSSILHPRRDLESCPDLPGPMGEGSVTATTLLK